MVLLIKPSGIRSAGEQGAGTEPGGRETVTSEAWVVPCCPCSSPVLQEYWALRDHSVLCQAALTPHLSPTHAHLFPSLQQQISPCAF